MTIDAAVLAGHPFLAGLSEAQLGMLAPLARAESHDEGVRLFREDARAEEFWLVRTGRVVLDIHLPGRGTVPLETIGAGGVVGWSWLFPPHRWHFGGLARTPVEAIRFDGAGVRAAMRDDAIGKELAMRFMAVVVDRLQHTRLRLLDLYGPAPVSRP